MQEVKFSVREALAEAESARNAGDLDRAFLLNALIIGKMPRHSRARKELQRLKARNPLAGTLTQAQVNQVIALYSSGKARAAAELAMSLIRLDPLQPILHNLAGMALAAELQDDKAKTYFQAAVALNPKYAEAWSNLGALLVRAGQTRAATDSLTRALQIKPDLAEAKTHLGLAHYAVQNYAAATQVLHEVLAAYPDDPNARNSMGMVLQDQRQLDEAVAQYQRGLQASPDNYDILVNLSGALAELDREAEAAEALEKAVQLNGGSADVWRRLAVQYSHLGRREEALATLDRALSLDETLAEAWRLKSMLTKFAEGDKDVAKMEEVLARTHEDATQRMHLSFALGKAEEDQGHHAKAFAHWQQANQARRSLSPYEIAVDEARVARVREVFDQTFFEQYTGPRDREERPIFVVGMMRSGTTLVEQILASHSMVAGAGEQNYFSESGPAMLESLAKGDTSLLAAFTEGYVQTLDRYRQNGERVVDKMPVNFIWIGLIKTVFPNAHIVNLVREPRDVCLSIYKNYFSNEGNLYSYDLEDIARFYILYRELMAYWGGLFPGEIYDVHYQKLTADPEVEVRALLEACNLPWEDGVMAFHQSRNTVKTASLGQVRQKIYQSSVDAWKRYEHEMQPADVLLKKAGF